MSPDLLGLLPDDPIAFEKSQAGLWILGHPVHLAVGEEAGREKVSDEFKAKTVKRWQQSPDSWGVDIKAAAIEEDDDENVFKKFNPDHAVLP